LPETDLSSSANVRAASKGSIFCEAKLRTMIAHHLHGARPERAQDVSRSLLPHRASRNRTAGLPRTSSCKSEALGTDNGYFIFDRSQHEARMVLMSVTEDRPASQQLRQQHGHVYGLESDHQTGVHFGVLSSCDRCVSSANALTLQLTLKSHVCAVHMQTGPRSRLSLEHSVSGDIVCRRT
jgi:hypothetical protein